MSINRQEFTTAGRDMLGRANNAEQLTISKVVIGAGRAAAPDELWPLTELLDYKMDAVITQRIDQGNGILLIDCGFNSSQAPEDFELCEVGVMARIDDEPERLYSVANVIATGADHVDPDVESIHAFKIKVVIDRAPNVTVIIGDSTDILAENIGAPTVGPGWFESKVANTLRFKRAVEGEGIELIEEAETITIGQRILKVDLDLYVPVNHPNAPGPEVAFPTIQAAHDYLLNFFIPTNVHARINVAAQVFTSTVPIRLTHPQGRQIEILGAEAVTSQITATFNAGTGLPGAFPIDFTVANGALFVTGDYVTIDFALNGGTQDYFAFGGVYEVINVTGNVVRVMHTNQWAWFPGTTGTNGTMTKFGSVLRFTGSSGFLFDYVNLGLLDRFILVGNRTLDNHGLNIINGAKIRVGTIGVHGFNCNVWVDRVGSSLIANRVYASNASLTGVAAFVAASIDILFCIANGNEWGVTSNIGSHVTFGAGSVISVNRIRGVQNSNGVIDIQNCFVSSNNGIGVACNNHGLIVGLGAALRNNRGGTPNVDAYATSHSYANFGSHNSGYIPGPPVTPTLMSHTPIDFSYIGGFASTPVISQVDN